MKKTTIKMSLWAFLLASMITPCLGQQASTVVNGFYGETQDISKLPKMEKDIVILQNVLSDLLGNKENNFYLNRGAKGMYIPGNGVIFSMGNSTIGSRFTVFNVRESRLDDSKEEKEESPEETNKKNEDNLKAKSREFLANYGSLLSELKSGEKVMLNVDYSELITRDRVSSTDERVAFISPRSNMKRMQSSISQKTLSDFTNGKISLEQAMNAVEIDVLADATDDRTDAKILAGILDDLLKSSMDGKFKRRSSTEWTYFEGFGLMFNIQMSTMIGNGVYVSSIRSAGNSRVQLVGAKKDEKEVDINELKKSVEEAYPEFENMLKENVIQYGRTLRSLKDGESIIVNVDLGSTFSDSKIPRSIRMVISKSTIDAYAKGQKTLDQVKQEIDITKLQSGLSNHGGVWAPSSASDQFFPAVVYETAPEPTVPRKVKGVAVKSNN